MLIRTQPTFAPRHPQPCGRVVVGMLVCIGFCLLAGCGREEVDVDPVVLTVGEREIYLSELQAQVDYWEARSGGLPVDRTAFVEAYAERMVMLEEAKKLGLDQDLELRHQWENMLIGRLKQDNSEVLLATLNMGEEAVEAYYEAHLKEFTKPHQIRLALLHFEASEQADERARQALVERMETARQLVQELPEGTRGFGKLAMTYSEEPTSRYKGGDVGWLEEGRARYRWPDAVVQAGFALQEIGSLSPVLETDKGVYLLMKLDERAERIRPLDARLRQMLETRLVAEKRSEIERARQSGWSASNPVSIDYTALSELHFPNHHSTEQKTAELTRMPD